MMLERGDVERFRDAVARRLGLYFDDGKMDYLADALRQQIEATGCPCAASYIDRLVTGGRNEVRTLAGLLTVTETYFLRNPDHFDALAEVVLPERTRDGRHSLRILSAGCASGEEAYSLAMTVRDRGARWFTPSQVQIHGVDINPTMIERALRARYSRWSLRGAPDEIRARYFRADGQDFVLDEAVRSMVTFAERNLIEDGPALWQRESYDVIFCRNVIMYWPMSTACLVIAHIAQALAEGGFLFLGHAETLRGISQDFHLRHTHGTFYYQRREAVAPRAGAAVPFTPPALPAALPIGPFHAMVESTESWVEAIQRASDRIADLARDPVGALPVQVPAARRPLDDLGRAVDLLRAERFRDALDLLHALPPEVQDDPDALLLRAVLMTNAGDLDDAEALCWKVLARDELNASAHYLVALCREHAGDRPGALEHDQTAVYLDAGFAMPRLHLGLLAKRSGDLPAARRELAQAQVLLASEDASRILLLGGGFTRDTLVELCRAELRACEGAP